MPRTITVVPKLPKLAQKKRVAAYARVSSGKDAMLHSLSAQVSYYSDLIQRHGDWLYVGVYADEAKTGTKDSRPDFQRLVADCHAGKIDLIITKSISRFARNTVTLLQTVRELKSLGVDVFFEEQNIRTMSGDGELMMTILASYAQEESRSASENQKWRIRRNFNEGLPWNGTVMGYRIVDGVYVPQDDEAELVKLIYTLYINGWGVYRIAKFLNKAGYRTRKGNEWRESVLLKLLRNYSYTGNLLLQTSYVENHISKKFKFNHGELPMYHAEDSHEAIIPMQKFQEAQEIRKERAEKYCHDVDRSIIYPFRGKLRCMDCGKNYRRKTVRNGTIWICSTYNSKGKEFCPTSKAIPEDTLIAVTAKVLGIDSFDGALFRDCVDRIEIWTENQLTYVLTDGRTETTVWADRSRSESWTEEKREAARQAALKSETPKMDPDEKYKKRIATMTSSLTTIAQHTQ